MASVCTDDSLSLDELPSLPYAYFHSTSDSDSTLVGSSSFWAPPPSSPKRSYSRLSDKLKPRPSTAGSPPAYLSHIYQTLPATPSIKSVAISSLHTIPQPFATSQNAPKLTRPESARPQDSDIRRGGLGKSRHSHRQPNTPATPYTRTPTCSQSVSRRRSSRNKLDAKHQVPRKARAAPAVTLRKVRPPPLPITAQSFTQPPTDVKWSPALNFDPALHDLKTHPTPIGRPSGKVKSARDAQEKPRPAPPISSSILHTNTTATSPSSMPIPNAPRSTNSPFPSLPQNTVPTANPNTTHDPTYTAAAEHIARLQHNLSAALSTEPHLLHQERRARSAERRAAQLEGDLVRENRLRVDAEREWREFAGFLLGKKVEVEAENLELRRLVWEGVCGEGG